MAPVQSQVRELPYATDATKKKKNSTIVSENHAKVLGMRRTDFCNLFFNVSHPMDGRMEG